MDLFQAIILAIIEGLTEFLPVSSTGHMIIASSMMGIASLPFTKLFTISIQLGAILSVVIVYRKKFLPQDRDQKAFIDFYKKIIIAFFPAVIAGLFIKKFVDVMLENVMVVAVALLLGGIIFLLLDKWFKRTEETGQQKLTSDKKALKIGLFQVIAMIPGVSRSAATIIGGLSQGLNKKAAAEFSFFLAVPTMFAATIKDLYDFYDDGGVLTSNEVFLLIIGNIVAFIVAMLAIRSFVAYLTKHGFKIFGYYRIVVGLIIIVLHLMGYDLLII
jgi:undecaprenyl-diphosphatase